MTTECGLCRHSSPRLGQPTQRAVPAGPCPPAIIAAVQESGRAIITGGSSGIGLALGKLLAQRGWRVALLARRAELLDEQVKELRERGASAAGIACDVTDSASVHDAVKRAEQELGGPFDLAVANAGVGLPTHAANFSLADAEQIIRVNV